MSRKHFVQLAAIVKGIKNPKERKRVAEETASMCASLNSLFNRSKFLEACGV